MIGILVEFGTTATEHNVILCVVLLNFGILNFVILYIAKLSVIWLNVIMMSVVALVDLKEIFNKFTHSFCKLGHFIVDKKMRANVLP